MSDAEILLHMANEISRCHSQLIIPQCASDTDARMWDMVALAMRLRSKPAIMLRALTEEWDRVRIVRELH